jgi:hypothetical protein
VYFGTPVARVPFLTKATVQGMRRWLGICHAVQMEQHLLLFVCLFRARISSRGRADFCYNTTCLLVREMIGSLGWLLWRQCHDPSSQPSRGGAKVTADPAIFLSLSVSSAAASASPSPFQAVFTSFKIPKILQDSPSHRIFRRMHRVLNIGKKITNYTVCL